MLDTRRLAPSASVAGRNACVTAAACAEEDMQRLGPDASLATKLMCLTSHDVESVKRAMQKWATSASVASDPTTHDVESAGKGTARSERVALAASRSTSPTKGVEFANADMQ